MMKLSNGKRRVLLLFEIMEKHLHYGVLILVNESLIQYDDFTDEDVDISDSTESVDNI